MNIIGYFTVPIKVIEGEISCDQDIDSYALDVKDLLDRQVSQEPALEMCYKWIGEEQGMVTTGFGKLMNRLI